MPTHTDSILYFGRTALMIGGLALAASCTTLEKTATVGAGAGVATKVLGGSTTTAVLVGLGAAAVTYAYFTYSASQEQKKEAEQNALAAEARMSANDQAAPKYIAVPTESKPDATTGETKKTVMIWDTENDTFVSGKAYEMETEPKTGETVKFDSVDAVYVGQ